MYTAPIYVLVFSVLFLGEKLTRVKISAIALMTVGCVLVSGVIEGFAFDAIGILFGLLAGISYGAYNIITKILMRRGADPTTTTFYSFALAAVLSFVVTPPSSLWENTAENLPLSVPVLIIFGVTTCVAPYFLYTFALRDLPAGTASSLGILEPMSATLLSAVFLTEIPSPLSFVGILLILGAVVLLGFAEKNIGVSKNE
jgi:drug/metabolite transporter (DMT)-like permease